MKSNKGFTLIEMAVVLAIIAVLAAIMTPIVTGYIDQARLARANEDTSRIGQAFLLHYRDTGRFPVWDTTAVLTTGTTPSKNCMVSGTTAALPTGGAANDASWTGTAACSGVTIGFIRAYLNVNTLNMNSAASINGAVSFRGPYLDGLDANDPWGQPYVVNSKYLATSGANAANWAFVISAGPDGGLNTVATQAKTAALSTANDDITSLIH